ncbi:MAG: putative toxin-antitoxin system toxin component, PIN family [Thermodesulfobacteriota bacterium]|nr:putative toxin-antitoxin system toxin component, PIN family [Thermodesulfobacteriota bacterium]
MKNKRFVFDTNVLLVSISSKSPYHWIFQKLIQQYFELAVTNDILSEYEEIISNKYSKSVAENIIRTLLFLPNVILTNIYFNWNLIKHDRDDDKFVDCAIASNSDAIITHDKHFNVLKNVPFPRVTVMNIFEFEKYYKG